MKKVKFKELTKREILAGLKDEIAVYEKAYRESDGKIHDLEALLTIRVLKAAARIVRLSPKGV